MLVAVGVAFIAGMAAGRPRGTSAGAHPVPHRSRVLIGALTFPVVVARSDGAIAFANARAEEWGLALSTRILPPAVRALAARAVTSGAMVDAEIRLARGVGRATVSVFAVAQPVPGEDLVVITAHDLESHAAAEVARREFVVNVSHELKTPIGALRLLGDAVSEAADEPVRVKKFAERMVIEADRLAGLAEQIIHLSRVQATETVFDPRPVSVAGVLADAIVALDTVAASRKVTVRADDLPEVTVSGDAGLLGMACRNLLENAILYSPEGSMVTVTVTIERGIVTVAILDRGIGIPQHEHTRVFERFYRADEARARESGGSGLGLAIVKHVARQHGGSVEVWSEPGVGSTFTLRLPVEAAPTTGASA